MIVLIDGTEDAIRVTEVDDFTRFKVVVRSAHDRDGLLSEMLGSDGWTDPPGHAYVRIDAIRGMCGDRVLDLRWIEGFNAMVAFAQSRGWGSPDGAAVRGHVENH